MTRLQCWSIRNQLMWTQKQRNELIEFNSTWISKYGAHSIRVGLSFYSSCSCRSPIRFQLLCAMKGEKGSCFARLVWKLRLTHEGEARRDASLLLFSVKTFETHANISIRHVHNSRSHSWSRHIYALTHRQSSENKVTRISLDCDGTWSTAARGIRGSFIVYKRGGYLPVA